MAYDGYALEQASEWAFAQLAPYREAREAAYQEFLKTGKRPEVRESWALEQAVAMANLQLKEYRDIREAIRKESFLLPIDDKSPVKE